MILLLFIGCTSGSAPPDEAPAEDNTHDFEPVPPDHPTPKEGGDKPLGWMAGGTITATSLKNGSAEVPGTLMVAGELTFADPLTLEGVDGELSVDLMTWDSQLELRDQRIRDTFFEVAQTPRATFEPALFKEGSLEGQLTLHGVSKPVSVPVEVLKSEGGVAVRSTEPWVVKISDYGMQPQLDALITLCGHESVADEVRLMVDVRVGEAPEWPAVETEGE